MKQDQLYCPLAWGSAAIRNNGDFRLCCHANVSKDSGLLRGDDGRVLNISDHPMEIVQNHPAMKEVRKSFLAGEWPEICVRCKTEESSGLKSGRTHAIARLKGAQLEEKMLEEVRNTSADGSVRGNFPVSEMDIRFGNLCNLRCRSCGPTDSSSWYRDWFELGNKGFTDSGMAIELKEIEGRISALPNRFSWHENTEAARLIPKDPSKLRRIYLAGGEPLLIPMHHKFLQELADQGLSGNIYLEYNSNLTHLPPAVLDQWKKFRAVGVGVSVDGVGKFHEYLRYPAKQVVLEKNLDILDTQPENISAWFACTVSWMNASHLPDFLSWILKRDFQKVGKRKDRLPVSFHLLHKPMHMNLREIPADAKKLIEDRLSRGWREVRGQFSEVQRNSGDAAFQGIIHYMNSSEANSKWPMHAERNFRLDLLRGKFFSDVDPELAEILGLMKNEHLKFRTESVVAVRGDI